MTDDNYNFILNIKYIGEKGKSKGKEKLREISYHPNPNKLLKSYSLRKLRTTEGLDSLEKILDKQQEIYDLIDSLDFNDI